MQASNALKKLVILRDLTCGFGTWYSITPTRIPRLGLFISPKNKPKPIQAKKNTDS